LCARKHTAGAAAAELSERKWLGGKYSLLSGSFKLHVVTKCDMAFLTTDTSNNILMPRHAQTVRNSSQQCQILQTLLRGLAYLSHGAVLLSVR